MASSLPGHFARQGSSQTGLFARESKLITDNMIAVLAMPLLLTTSRTFNPICATGPNHLSRPRIALAPPRTRLMGNPPIRIPNLTSDTSKRMMEPNGNYPGDYSAGYHVILAAMVRRGGTNCFHPFQAGVLQDRVRQALGAAPTEPSLSPRQLDYLELSRIRFVVV